MDSTNDYLRKYTPEEGEKITIVVADYQTAGRGQGTNTWESEAFQYIGTSGNGAYSSTVPSFYGWSYRS